MANVITNDIFNQKHGQIKISIANRILCAYNNRMNHISFDWDEKKNNTNQKKHKIDFAEAQTCFYDPNALVIHDPDHSDDEDRFILMGLSKSLRILVVCHCYREPEETIRIISARKATTSESQTYGG